MAYLRAQPGSPNDEILMGCIGVGGQGIGNMTNFLNIQGVRVVAVCDVDSNQAAKAKAKVDAYYKNSDCKIYAHHADLLQHPGLDAVSLATPDHWHARIGIDCANAGKDIYGEKPFTWGLAEGRVLVDALTKNKRVWQTGCWQRSGGRIPPLQGAHREQHPRQDHPLRMRHALRHEHPTACARRTNGAEMIGKPPAQSRLENLLRPGRRFPLSPDDPPVELALAQQSSAAASCSTGSATTWTSRSGRLGLDGTGPVKMEGTGENGNHEFFNTYVKYSYQGTFADGRVARSPQRLRRHQVHR